MMQNETNRLLDAPLTQRNITPRSACGIKMCKLRRICLSRSGHNVRAMQ